MRRPLLLGAVWAASAGTAVGLGYLAVSLVDASASPGTAPAAASTAAPTPTGTAATTPAVSPPTAQHVTVAGTVFADCTGGAPRLALVPAPGWWVDDSSDPGEVEFESKSQKLEVTVACGPDGAPVFSDEGLRSDSDGGRSSSSSSQPAPTPAATSSGAQVSDDPPGDDRGRGGESDDDSSGHGSGDDSDDSSGRGSGGDDRGRDVESDDDSGGHGSDD
jgi:hypothetical protein